MPIRAEHRWLYPLDWPQLSAVIRFERAGGRCEHCARPHGQLVYRLGDGRWWDEERGAWRDGRGRRLISITIRATAARATWRPSASAATFFTIGPSIGVADRLLFGCARPWVICSSDRTSFGLIEADRFRARTTMANQPRFELFGFWRTSATYRVRVALNLKGLAAEEHGINLDTGEQRSEAFLKINPLGGIPALLEQGHAP